MWFYSFFWFIFLASSLGKFWTYTNSIQSISWQGPRPWQFEFHCIVWRNNPFVYLLLAFASFIQYPLAQGSAEPFLIYLCHSSHYFINQSKSFSRICFWGWGALLKLLFSYQIVTSKPSLPAERHRHGIALSSEPWTWREAEGVPSHLSHKRVQLVACMVTALLTEDWSLCQEHELPSDF